MDALRINVQDGFFKSVSKSTSESVTKNKAIGNGWIATVKKDGTIKCITEEKTEKGTITVRFTIYPNKKTKLTIKENKEPVRVLRKGFIESSTEKLNGNIYLLGGEITKRYGYFRDADLKSFLKKHNLASISHKDPNTEYSLKTVDKPDFSRKDEISTDGKVAVIETKQIEENITITKVNVTDATWAIVKINGKGGKLYTKIHDAKKIELPE